MGKYLIYYKGYVTDNCWMMIHPQCGEHDGAGSQGAMIAIDQPPPAEIIGKITCCDAVKPAHPFFQSTTVSPGLESVVH